MRFVNLIVVALVGTAGGRWPDLSKSFINPYNWRPWKPTKSAPVQKHPATVAQHHISHTVLQTHEAIPVHEHATTAVQHHVSSGEHGSTAVKEHLPTAPVVVETEADRWAATRSKLDNFVPDSHHALTLGTNVVEETSIGKVLADLSKAPMVSSSSLIYFASLENGRKVVMKFTNNCDALGANAECSCSDHPTDELLVEGRFATAVNDLEVVPRILFLSSSKQLHDLEAPQVQTEVLTSHPVLKTTCLGMPHPAVRMMVQERAGVDIFGFWLHAEDLMNRKPPAMRWVFKSFIRVVIQVIERLQTLHEHGIIHGDIRIEKVAFANPDKPVASLDPKVDKIVLLDLSEARFFPAEIGSAETGKPHLGLDPESMSPWQLAHYRIGRRDDIFRTVQMLAKLLSFGDASDRWSAARIEKFPRKVNDKFSAQVGASKISNKLVNLAHVKMYGNFFEPDDRFGYQGVCPRYNLRDKFCMWLEGFLREVRAIPTVDDRPNYPFYLSRLAGVIGDMERDYGNEHDYLN